MGYVNAIIKLEGTSAKQAFDKEMNDDKVICRTSEDDSDFTGDFLGECTFAFDKYDKENEDKAEELISAEGCGNEYIIDYVDLGIVRYELIELAQRDINCDTKFDFRYIVTSIENSERPIDGIYYGSILEANSFAYELSINNLENYIVRKKYVPIDGYDSDITTQIHIKVTKFADKPVIEETSNIKIREIHKYMFYGWSPY